MGAFGNLTPENIEKTINSLTYQATQLNNVPSSLKPPEFKLAREQIINLIFTLNQIKLILEGKKEQSNEFNVPQEALYSSLKASNELNYQMEAARIKKEGKDAKLDFFRGLQRLMDK